MKHKLKIIFLAFTGIITLTLGACSTQEEITPVKPAVQTLDQAIYLRAKTAYLAKNYKTAAALLDPIAEKGNPNAQYTLGYLYYYGKGVKRNLALAMKWFKKAASQDHQRAINALKTITQAINNKPAVTTPAARQVPVKVVDLRLKKTPVPLHPAPVPVSAAPVLPASIPVNKSALIKIISPAPTAVVTKKPAKKIPVISAKRVELEEKGRLWIMNQPAEHFTIQLASSASEKSVLDFIKNVALDGVFLFRYTDKKGQPRLNVIHGSIFSFSNAKKKLTRLHQRGFKNAWIRGIGPIQKMINH